VTLPPGESPFAVIIINNNKIIIIIIIIIITNVGFYRCITNDCIKYNNKLITLLLQTHYMFRSEHNQVYINNKILCYC
jgi:hypothetical protein